jgi:hypothetical protein
MVRSKIKIYNFLDGSSFAKASTPRGTPCVLTSVVSVQYREGDPKTQVVYGASPD